MSELPPELPMPGEVFARQRSVLAQIGETRPGPRRRLAVAVVSLALLGAMAVTPARSVGGQLVDLIWSPSAPPAVQASFASSDWLRKRLFDSAEAAGATLDDRFSPVISQETRGIFALATVDGPLYLWAAPTRDGRECWLIQAGAARANGRPYGVHGCDQTDEAVAFRPSVFSTAERPSVKIVSVRVYDRSISRVDVQLVGGATIRLPVVAGYALGIVGKKQRLIAFIGRQAAGNTVLRMDLRPRG